MDSNGILLNTNPAAMEALGVREGELESTNVKIQDLISSPTDLLAVPEGIEVGAEVIRSELPSRTVKVRRYQSVDGGVQRSVLIFCPRHPAELKVFQNEMRFRAIFHSGMIGMKFWNETGRLTDANDAFLEMVGYERQEILDGTVDRKRMTPPEYLALDAQAVNEVIRTGACKPFRKEYIRKDGTRIPVMVGGARIPTDSGVCGVAFIVDLSKRQAIEQEKEKLLVNEQAARQASSLKSAFLANVSHEIRTPLSAIVGLSELMLDTDLNSQQREFTEIIKSSATTLTRLVTDILDFSKIEADKLIIERIPFDLRNVIEEMENEFRWLADSKGLYLEVDCPSKIPQLVGDPGRLGQILRNLISNSIKFTEIGFVAIRVKIQSVSDSVLTVRFEIQDTGIGLESSTLEKLFEPFVQSDSSTTRKYGGTGLGLSISKRLVELMGGEIQLRSVMGEGTSFWFELSFDFAGMMLPSSWHQADRPVEFSPGYRVLIVEDIPTNQIVLTSLLHKVGVPSDAVSGGEAALAALEQKNYDLVFMDCHMPKMDGYTATRLIRSNPNERIRHLPIVAMTASAMLEDREKCLRAGMNDYLTKPVSRAMITRSLMQWFSVASEDETEETDSPIDWRTIKLLSDLPSEDSPNLVGEMLELFNKNVPLRIAALRSAIEEKDLERVIREAHGLKSATCYLGAQMIGHLCEEIGIKARNGGLEGAAELCQSLEAEYRRVLRHLS